MDLEKRSEDEGNETSISRYLKYPLIGVGIYYIYLSLYELVDSFVGIADSISNYLN